MTAQSLTFRLESSDFSCEHLQVHRFSGKEEISRLFSFDIGFVSTEETPLDCDAIAGAELSLVIENAGVEVRRIHGMVAEITDSFETEADMQGYRLRMVPLWWGWPPTISSFA
jgi:type VI secretion system secreted protein VgrG